MNEMMIFSNPEFGNVRTVTIDGDPWFVGIDVARALGYARERSAIASHVDKEDALKCGLPSNSGVQETIVINESGLYISLLKAKKHLDCYFKDRELFRYEESKIQSAR